MTQVVAVAGRTLEEAKSFAEEFNIPTVCASYEELASNPDVGREYTHESKPVKAWVKNALPAPRI